MGINNFINHSLMATACHNDTKLVLDKNLFTYAVFSPIDDTEEHCERHQIPKASLKVPKKMLPESKMKKGHLCPHFANTDNADDKTSVGKSNLSSVRTNKKSS